MKEFDYSKLKDRTWDNEILTYVAQIHEYKGKQELYMQQKPVELKRLIEIAKIQSTESSNEIEGIVLTGSVGSATKPFNFENEINKYFKNKYSLKVISKESGAIGAAQIAMDVYNGKKEILGILVDY